MVNDTFPLAPRVPSVAPPGDTLGQLLLAIQQANRDIGHLDRMMAQLSTDGSVTNSTVQNLQQQYGLVRDSIAQLEARLSSAEETARRHDSGFGHVKEDDEEMRRQIASAEKSAREANEKADKVMSAVEANTVETSAQTPMLAKVEKQTQTITTPMKVAAGFNTFLGLVHLLIEVAKAFHQ